jgi:hypothetical protein
MYPVCPKHAVSETVGVLTGGSRILNPQGDPAQVLDEHQAQGDRDGPQLANGQGLDLLKGAQVATEAHRVEQTVRMRNKFPGNGEDPRISPKFAAGEFRKLAIIARGKIDPNITDLPLYDMEIVDQPFSRRRYGGVSPDGCGNIPANGDQDGFILRQTAGKSALALPDRADDQLARQAPGVILEALYAEDLAPDRRAAAPDPGGTGHGRSMQPDKDGARLTKPHASQDCGSGAASIVTVMTWPCRARAAARDLASSIAKRRDLKGARVASPRITAQPEGSLTTWNLIMGRLHSVGLRAGNYRR